MEQAHTYEKGRRLNFFFYQILDNLRNLAKISYYNTLASDNTFLPRKKKHREKSISNV